MRREGEPFNFISVDFDSGYIWEEFEFDVVGVEVVIKKNKRFCDYFLS